MVEQNKFGDSNQNPSCVEFDTRLADLLDGAMVGTELEAFRSHAATCLDCGPLFTQAERGMRYLKTLPEVEPPANLLHNILAATTMAEPSSAPALAGNARSWLRRVGDTFSPRLVPALAGLMQPRLAMTAAMAFFSISMLMNVTGVRLSDIRNLDLRPSAISTSASLQYHATTAKVVKYYENIRFVYELQTRVQELKRAAGAGDQNNNAAPADEQQKKQPSEPDSSQNPPQQQNEKYSLEQNDGTVVAKLTDSELSGLLEKRLEQNWRTS